MLPKPSLVLQVKLQPDHYSEAAAAEIKRSYMYLAQSLVSALDPSESSEGNVMRMSIRLMRPYWDPADAAAEELWQESFMPWLVNVTRNLSTAMHNFNTVMHPAGSGNVDYTWGDFDFGPHGIFRVRLDDENRLPAEAPSLLDKGRRLAAAGAFEGKVILIRLPSRASEAAQREAFDAAQAAYEQERAAWEQARAAYDERVAENPDDDTLPDPGPAPIAPIFALDYGTWGIERADGTVEELDSRSA